MLNKLRSRVARDEKGFTLIELLVVVIILGILTAIAIPSYLSFRGRSEDAANKSNVRAIIPAIETWYSDHDTYVGMDNATTGLKTIDQSVDMAAYRFTNVGATTYCVQYPAGTGLSHTFSKAGPAAQIAKADCA